MSLTMAAPAPVWTAVNLDNCRTAFLESIDLARIPAAAALAISGELSARRDES